VFPQVSQTAQLQAKKNAIQPLFECQTDVKYDLKFAVDFNRPTGAVAAVPRRLRKRTSG